MRIMIRRAEGGISNLEIPVDGRFEELLTMLSGGHLAAIHLYHSCGTFTVEPRTGAELLKVPASAREVS